MMPWLPNSLKTGKITGNAKIFGHFGDSSCQFIRQFQHVARKFPIERNREFSSPNREFSAGTGKTGDWPLASIFARSGGP
jgi:hypothetical protein